MIIWAPKIKSSTKLKTNFTYNNVNLFLEKKAAQNYPPIIQKLSKIWLKYTTSSTPTKFMLAMFTETNKKPPVLLKKKLLLSKVNFYSLCLMTGFLSCKIGQ